MNVISFKIAWWHGEHDPDKSPASWNYLGTTGTKSGWHLKQISVPYRPFRGWPCGLILNVFNQTHNSSSRMLSISRLDASTNICILFLFKLDHIKHREAPPSPQAGHTADQCAVTQMLLSLRGIKTGKAQQDVSREGCRLTSETKNLTFEILALPLQIIFRLFSLPLGFICLDQNSSFTTLGQVFQPALWLSLHTQKMKLNLLIM